MIDRIWHGIGSQVFDVRTLFSRALRPHVALFFGFGLLIVTGCADAPVTPAQVADDGQLRPIYAAQSLVNVAPAPAPLQAQNLQLTVVLADTPSGALEDTTTFLYEEPRRGEEPKAVHLHLRADNLDAPRPVTIVWTHGEVRTETMGFLGPSETLSLAASLPLVPESMGAWRVEVHGQSPSGSSLLYERAFEVVLPGEQPS